MPAKPPRRRSKATTHGAHPAETGQEALYLRFLSEKQAQVHLRLRDGEVVTGWIEYFDDAMVRLTREGKPNLFIYKEQIRTISEQVRREESSRRPGVRRTGAAGGEGTADQQEAGLPQARPSPASQPLPAASIPEESTS